MGENSFKLIFILILVAGISIIGTIFFLKKTGYLQSNILPPERAAQKAIDFINKNVLEEGSIASLLKISEESGIYKLRLKIKEQEFDSYVTKDGKLLFFQGIDMERAVFETQALKEKAKEEEKFSEEQLEALAKCLSEKGAKFYGAYWCSWCKKQKEIFGKAAQFLPYIECIDEKTQQMTSQCQEAEISGFPTWEFNGKKSSGFKTIKELAELSGCSL